MSMSDLELLQLVETVKEKQRGPVGPAGVGIERIEQFDATGFTLRLTDGSFKRIDLPAPKDGEAGPVGPAGPKGEAGSAGRPGRDGVQGPSGRDGQDGLAGSSIETAVVNSNGHLLLGISDGSIIDVGRVVGPAGATGERGSTGLPGEPGADGAAVLSGPRAPQQSDGVNGDHWIDISSNEFGFYKKSGDGWTKVANLRQPATDRAVGGTGGGTATSKIDSTNVNLKRSARSGDAPKFVDLPTLVNQMQFNWFAENQLNIDRTEIISNADEINKLKAVSGIPHIYTLKDESGGSVTTGEFSTNAALSASVTEIKISALSVDGTPLPIAQQGDSLVLERRSDGQTARYEVTTVTSATQFGVQFESETSTDVLTVGGEYDVFLFPTATTPVVVSATEPTSPALGDLWFNVNAGDDLFVLFIWDGTDWRSVPSPPSLDQSLTNLQAAIDSNTSSINNNGLIIATQQNEIDNKLEKDGSNAASDIQFQNATFSENLTVEGSASVKKIFTVNRPRSATASNSFIIKGNKGSTEGQSIFYDYREPSDNPTDTKMIYNGPMIQDNEIVTKAYVDARGLPYSVDEFNTKMANLEALVETLQNRVAELESAN